MKRKLPTEEEIDAVLNVCAEIEETGCSKFPSESYEAGVKNAILWLQGQVSDNPME